MLDSDFLSSPAPLKLRKPDDPRMKALLGSLAISAPPAPEIYCAASLVADYHECRDQGGPYMAGVSTGAILAFAEATGQNHMALTVALCDAEKASAGPQA
jgi:hypothetical protein